MEHGVPTIGSSFSQHAVRLGVPSWGKCTIDFCGMAATTGQEQAADQCVDILFLHSCAHKSKRMHILVLAFTTPLGVMRSCGQNAVAPAPQWPNRENAATSKASSSPKAAAVALTALWKLAFSPRARVQNCPGVAATLIVWSATSNRAP